MTSPRFMALRDLVSVKKLRVVLNSTGPLVAALDSVVRYAVDSNIAALKGNLRWWNCRCRRVSPRSS